MENDNTAHLDNEINPADEHLHFHEILRVERMNLDFTNEDLVKRRCLESYTDYLDYLMIPIHYKNKDGTWDTELFERLVYHAYLPEIIVQDTIIQCTSVCFKSKPDIELPNELEYIKSSLEQIARDAILELLISGRFALYTDINEETGKPELLFYKSSAIPNWGVDGGFYTFSETNEEGKEERRVVTGSTVSTYVSSSKKPVKFDERDFTINRDDKSRTNRSRLISPSGNFTFQDTVHREAFKGLPLDVDPVQYVEILPALKGQIKSMQKGFRQSAQYYSMLDTLAGGKLVLYTDRDFSDIQGGHERGLILGKGEKAELLQLKSDGASILENSMNRAYEDARTQGLELITQGANKASAENLSLQLDNKQLKISDLATLVSKAITDALIVASVLIGCNDDIKYQLNVNLIKKQIDTKLLTELRASALSGLILRSDYVKQLEKLSLLRVKKHNGTVDYEQYVIEANEEFEQLQGVD
jgi:hypothetical protein